MPDINEKAVVIFRELVGERAVRVSSSRLATETMDRILEVLAPRFGVETANLIGCHIGECVGDAAFLVALQLFPERFTNDEIDDWLGCMMIDSPDHMAAAAKLYGTPIRDTFGLGPLVADD